MPEETGRIPWNKGMKMQYSSEHIQKIKKILYSRKGKNHPNWIEEGTIRHSGKYIIIDGKESGYNGRGDS